MLPSTLAHHLPLLVGLAACEVHSVAELVPQTVDEDPAIPALEVNRTKLHVETFGDPGDPAIVFLHSGPGDDFRAMLPLLEETEAGALEEDHFLVLFDQRGSGLSRRHDDPDELTLDLWIEDVGAVLDAIVPDRAVALVGHSGGGLLAAGFLDRYPERVRGAVLLEPSPLTGELAEELATTTSLEMSVLDEWVNDWMWGQGMVSPKDHASLDYALTQAVQDTQGPRHSDGPVPTWRYGGAAKIAMTLGEMSEYDYDFASDHLADAIAPVLVVAGGDTVDMGEAFQERQLAFFQDAQLVVIPDAGHNDLVYWQADDTLSVIAPFLRSLP